MRFVLPQFATPIVRTFEVATRRMLGLGIVTGWRLDGTPVHVADLWRELGEELPAQVPVDQGIPKSRGELIVSGVAHSEAAAAAVHVRVAVGSIDKTLYVVGDRRWVDGEPTAPEAFERMPLGWDRAFGGAGFEGNPLGRGAEGVRLPNVESPGQLIAAPSDRPEPAGLGPIEVTRATRMRHAGTYDRRWLETAYPGFAEDTDWRLFQLAPPDQWLAEMWVGDEPILALNLHADHARLEGRLPGVRARGFMQRRGQEALEETPLRLSTVWLIPHRELVVLVHHGSAETVESDGSDVELLLVGLEGFASTRAPEHYARVLEQRRDPEWGALATLDDKPLMPEGLALPSLGDAAELPLRDGRLQDNLKARSVRAQQELRDSLRGAGVEPTDEDAIRLPERPRVEPEKIPSLIADLKRRAKEAAEVTKARVAKLREELGHDEAAPLPGGPPLLAGTMLRERVQTLVEVGRQLDKPVEGLVTQLADPDFQRLTEAQDHAAREGYRRGAHMKPAAEPGDPEEARRLRSLVEASQGDGDLAEADLTGADLSNLDLRNRRLTGAWLEGANLQCADLRGADLSGAVLARADLSDAKLDGANLRGANLGHARLLYATAASGLDLTDAVLHAADLRGATLTGCTLRGADLTEARFEETDLSGADAEGMILIGANLVGASLARASLKNANLIEVDLSGVDLTGANLEKAVLLGCNATGAVFHGARLGNLRAVEGCTFDRADFREADLTGANLRGASALGAAFGLCKLDDADLSELRAADATFYRASARRARFVKADLTRAQLVGANLMDALLGESTLHGADLRGSNLFAADLWDAKGDAELRLDDALITRARFRKELRS